MWTCPFRGPIVKPNVSPIISVCRWSFREGNSARIAPFLAIFWPRQIAHNDLVAGSSPAGPTTRFNAFVAVCWYRRRPLYLDRACRIADVPARQMASRIGGFVWENYDTAWQADWECRARDKASIESSSGAADGQRTAGFFECKWRVGDSATGVSRIRTCVHPRCEPSPKPSTTAARSTSMFIAMPSPGSPVSFSLPPELSSGLSMNLLYLLRSQRLVSTR